ncbi:MAG: DUF1538 domain-containing protein [Flavobacterium sp.]
MNTDLIYSFIDMFISTLLDVAPIVILIAFFQIVIIKKNIPNVKNVILGIVFVIIGLTFFLLGLEKALFPVGDLMAKQLSNIEFIEKNYSGDITDWQAYYWVYLFGLMMGFATTMAEPALKAVAIKANEVSGGTISETGLRVVVAIGAGVALALGTYRIVTGTPLYHYLIVCYVIIIIQTIFAKKDIVALAYDSGGVTTSTVTVPIVAALGLGLSSVIPGRNPAIDGFGLIALVCMFPIISVLAYTQLTELLKKFKTK